MHVKRLCVSDSLLKLKNYLHLDFITTVITPDSPGVVIVDPDSYTSSSVSISWTESPSVCDTTFSYNVSSTNTNDGTTTSNNAVLGDLVPSDDPYGVIVTATDYTTRTSDESCFLFNGENY